jgi:hypothetical protein
VGAIRGKAPADTPALKPYWGKPAVRNFRGDDGNVGIMRSPVRAIVLPDRAINRTFSAAGKAALWARVRRGRKGYGKVAALSGFLGSV